MATPSNKSEGMEKVNDTISLGLYGRTRTQAIMADICVIDGNTATEFKDDISRKEYTISGMCQKCQDEFFGV